jgi:hypothetical protein
MESLDLSIPRPGMGTDESEFHVTRNFTYFAKVVRNVRRMNNVYSRIKKKKEWGIDPDFVQLNPSFESWMNDLPGDLQITFPPDGSPHIITSVSLCFTDLNSHLWSLLVWTVGGNTT